jgi:DNA-binding phage protein
MKINIAPFDVADYLTDNETIAEYINAALEDPNPDMLLIAQKNVARARGMAQLAKDTELQRTNEPGSRAKQMTLRKPDQQNAQNRRKG